MVDVSHIKGVKIGDEVVIIGRQKNEEISATELADIMGTINYEIICNISERIPRKYI
jgi:alanine racemase